MTNQAIKDNLNRKDALAARDKGFARLEELRKGGRPSRPVFVFGVLGQGRTNPYENPEQWLEECLEDLAGRVDALFDEEVFRPLVVEFGAYGVHFVDRLFGAESFEIEPGNWQVYPLQQEVGTLKAPDLETDPTWNLARRTAEAFLAHQVRLPLFGLPTIASALNIAMNLYGQELMLAFITDPEGARRDLKTINDTLISLHRWFQEKLPESQLQPVVAWERTQAPGYGQICGCSNMLLSKEQYAEMVADLDEELLALYPKGGMLHLCGKHTQHLDCWREMQPLKAVQLNDGAAEDLEMYFKELREDQMFYVNPCPGMPVEKILEITGGERTVIVADAPKG